MDFRVFERLEEEDYTVFKNKAVLNLSYVPGARAHAPPMEARIGVIYFHNKFLEADKLRAQANSIIDLK